MTTRKKLIEVILPLDAINNASAREKSIRHGHPSTLHLWWARRPAAVARAILFAQMVDDPSSWPNLFLTDEKQRLERQRLLQIIEDLVKWENTANEKVLQEAHSAIRESWRRGCSENSSHSDAEDYLSEIKLPAFHDPFAGGATLPLEARRLGLEVYASDLNPVAVLINKALIEIPAKFSGRPPINPDWKHKNSDEQAMAMWTGAWGLAEDVRYYSQWIQEKAKRQIGHLYPTIKITKELAENRPDLTPYKEKELPVIAWIWVRTVKSPNPAFASIEVPLASTFFLSKKDKKKAYIYPVIEQGGYRFTVRTGPPENLREVEKGTKTSGANFKCIMSQVPITSQYIKNEGKNKRIGMRLMAIVAKGRRGRLYIDPQPEHEQIALACSGKGPSIELSGTSQYLGVKPYGMATVRDLFTNRQLIALSTLSNLVEEAHEQVNRDSNSANIDSADQYADAIATYLALSVSRQANRTSSLNFWDADGENIQQVFARQALSMTWDFVESNPIGSSSGSYFTGIKYMTSVLKKLPVRNTSGHAFQKDATTQKISAGKIISTDPPYYDNIPYADLSDFFYAWLRKPLRRIFPSLLSTLAVPKSDELVAFAHRHHKNKKRAEEFFLDKMTNAMRQISDQAHKAYPTTIYYAFRQSKTDDVEGTVSTGWDTFLEAVIRAGFSISGTWPIRTEYTKQLKTKRNALASSIVLVCRTRPTNAPTITRKEFFSELKQKLPKRLATMQLANIAPVDFAQAAIGPGMQIYTRYAEVRNAKGERVPVREALALINKVLDETLAKQENNYDVNSRWALAWFEQNGFSENEYGSAETLCTAKNTSIDSLLESGIANSKPGRVRLLRPEELQISGISFNSHNVWRTTHYLIHFLKTKGEASTAALIHELGSQTEFVCDLAYRLYIICERKNLAAEAMSYNSIAQTWAELKKLAQESNVVAKHQEEAQF